ncbi:putative propionyl-CoA carboxylase beta chain 6 [Pseudonocardia sulfidoxydans NBRC 16205]|uniref:Putative propionyl-CoA carboxylase beta chain 6 n=1 Tax=Pseudonocardia sulfidoxydans NBRC 16205 TaxID=1223511 RepID=A0A511DQI1_9PSEU|nr:carboxyl transferase domain-containing protein [Pseudonocardia sulfidoxydans]GEL25328.1 putative propionyl-CoA carboxylase beta chain 6 [Pseudonocardia sulfidoxydans NBRC 16205]
MSAAVEHVPDAARRDPAVRLADLCDPGTLHDVVAVDGLVAGRGLLDGVASRVFATDPRVQGGALGRDGCALVVGAYDAALTAGEPVVGIWQSGGARLREGAGSLDAIGRIFRAMTLASGRIPQVSVVLGPSAGGAAYGPALTDVVVTGPDARVFVTGPDVVRSVTGEDVDALSLGGPQVHARHSGVAHVAAPDDDAAYTAAREIVGLLADRRRPAPRVRRAVDPATLMPPSPRRAYDVRPVVDALLDAPAHELAPRWAPNIVTALGRIDGRSVGVLANNPLRLGGCLTATSSDKAARFVRTCDSLGVPLVVLVDVPGYLPGAAQELDGVVRRGAKLLHAFACASVPRVTVVTRKAYGGAYIAMNSTSLGATRVFAWPAATVDVMNPVAAVRILHRRDLAGLDGAARDHAEAALVDTHARETGGLADAVAAGYVDEIVAPAATRDAIARTLAAAADTRGRPGNMPL